MDILKEKGLIRFGFYIIVLFLLLAAGCSNNDDSSNADNALDYNVSFIIEKKNNPNLKSDIWLSSDTDTLYAFIPDLEKSDSIIVSFYGNYDNVEVGGIQDPCFTFQDFNHIVKYVFPIQMEPNYRNM